MKNTITIWKKELKDTIRDRRTLMAMIIMPMLLMPVIIIGMGKFVEYQMKSAEEKVVRVAIENQEVAPALVETIKSGDKIEVVDLEGDLEQALREEKIEAGMVIPETFAQSISNQQPVEVTIKRKSINLDSETALSRLAKSVSDFNNQILLTRFSERSVDPAVLSGVAIKAEDIATKQETGGFGLGFLLPLFIVMWSVIGGQYTAIDVSAGEKERKTLESLLLTPVRRLDVVFGIFLAVSSVALTLVIVVLGSMYAAIVAFGPGIFGQIGSGTAGTVTFDFSIEPTALLILFGVSILLVLMFSAIQLSVSIFAKSYKEAQGYIGPMYLVVILPTVLVNALPSFKPEVWFFALPVVNAILLFKEVLIGEYDVVHIITTVISLIIYVFIAIFIATKIYQKEGVLFKD